MTVYLQDTDLTLHHGDCLEVLRTLPDRSVHACMTSPPFYGLRNYDVDGQIGLEETPDQWVERLVAVFREVRRVLRDDGTLWVEIGDSYAASWPCSRRNLIGEGSLPNGKREARPPRLGGDLKTKDLIGGPWALAFALRADGWYLRSEIIWARPNPMPESVTDRPTKAHSTVFLLSKRPRYFYDADAIREPSTVKPENAWRYQYGRYGSSQRERSGDGLVKETSALGEQLAASTANARSVWQIPTEPTPFAHFATWPRKLVARMILAGTSERGCCPECGAPWVRETAVELEFTQRTHNATATPESMSRRGSDKSVPGRNHVTTLGWSPSCAHDHPPVPCTVLDPFAGSGTTLLVARQHGRHSIGIELNQSYCELVRDRTSQQSLLADVS